jgi:hypothetical protein
MEVRLAVSMKVQETKVQEDNINSFMTVRITYSRKIADSTDEEV